MWFATSTRRTGSLQIIDGDLYKKTLLDLEGIAIVYPEDYILLQVHVEHLKFNNHSGGEIPRSGSEVDDGKIIF